MAGAGAQDGPFREEVDSLGPMPVPAEAHWGAQTARSIGNFPIGDADAERMPLALVHALARVKQAAARVNRRHGLPGELADAIDRAAADVAQGRHDGQFPLRIWQTGSGTQTNMNVNEVIASLANERLTGQRGGRHPVHPNDHVNRGQSSNDAVPTAMHIAVAIELRGRLLPALHALADSFRRHEAAWAGLVTIGRTHLMDAVPITLGQQASAWAQTATDGADRVVALWPRLARLAIGGTAVGTGLNAPPGFAADMVATLGEVTGGIPWQVAANPFEALATHDTLVEVAGVLATIATGMLKISTDIRLLASGPRAGFAELRLPANEPGSSIMPGKVNPTQAEALAMVAAQVIGNAQAVVVAGGHGHLQLNAMKPLIAHNLLRAIRLLADALDSFRLRCVDGLAADEARIAGLVAQSLMLVTALVPAIGYDRAAAVAHKAHAEGLTLRDAALALGVVDAPTYDRLVKPEAMIGGGSG